MKCTKTRKYLSVDVTFITILVLPVQWKSVGFSFTHMLTGHNTSIRNLTLVELTFSAYNPVDSLPFSQQQL